MQKSKEFGRQTTSSACVRTYSVPGCLPKPDPAGSAEFANLYEPQTVLSAKIINRLYLLANGKTKISWLLK